MGAPSYLYLSEFATACTFGAENISSIRLFDNPVPPKFVKIKEKVATKLFGKLKISSQNSETDNTVTDKLKTKLFKFGSHTKMPEFAKSTQNHPKKVPSRYKPPGNIPKRPEKEQLASKAKRVKLDEMQVPREKYIKLEQ